MPAVPVVPYPEPPMPVPPQPDIPPVQEPEPDGCQMKRRHRTPTKTTSLQRYYSRLVPFELLADERRTFKPEAPWIFLRAADADASAACH